MANLYIDNIALQIILDKYVDRRDISHIIAPLTAYIVNDDIQRMAQSVDYIAIDATLSRLVVRGNIIRILLATHIYKDDKVSVDNTNMVYNTFTGSMSIVA